MNNNTHLLFWVLCVHQWMSVSLAWKASSYKHKGCMGMWKKIDFEIEEKNLSFFFVNWLLRLAYKEIDFIVASSYICMKIIFSARKRKLFRNKFWNWRKVLCSLWGEKEAFLKSEIIYEMNCILGGIKEMKWSEIEAGTAFNLSLSTQLIWWFHLKTGHFSPGIS